jgi:RsiW-degrading membrane proteinase PrsW (M82 family)
LRITDPAAPGDTRLIARPESFDAPAGDATGWTDAGPTALAWSITVERDSDTEYRFPFGPGNDDWADVHSRTIVETGCHRSSPPIPLPGSGPFSRARRSRNAENHYVMAPVTPGMPNRDPVALVLGDTEDLYDVAEWDSRSVIDKLSVVIYAVLHGIKRYGLIALAILLFVAQLAFAGLIVLDDPRLGILAVLSAVPALLLVGYVWYDDPTRREPIDALAITFVLAILFASFAALVNSALQPLFSFVPVVGMALFFFVVVGPIEETVKWLAIRSHAYGRDDFDAVIDGAVYGAIAGLGFATIENALYITQGYMQAASMADASQIQQAAGTALGRGFVGPGHVLYSAFAGYYLGLAKFNRENAGPIVVKGIIIAALIHGTYNTIVTYAPAVIPWNLFTFVGVVLVFDLIVGYALYRKISRYTKYYHRAMDEGSVERATAAPEDD